MAEHAASVRANHEQPHKLERTLKRRHLEFIALGGALGSGLFLGSGLAIHTAGPSIILVYAFIGLFTFLVMRAMGEILLSNLSYKSFADFANDVVGSWAGFYVGWTYWMVWVIIAISDVIAITAYLEVWFPDLPKWIPALAMILLLTGLNLVASKAFGEIEFWFAAIKIVTIIALIAVGIIVVAIRFQPEGHQAASVTHLWSHGGFFPNGFAGLLGGFQLGVFSFLGVELAGTVAAETEDPEKNLPRAINSIPARVMLFYVLSLTLVMMVQPWDAIDASSSPFVQVFGFIGIPIAFHIVNFVMLTAAASSANSGIFSTSRIMWGLSKEGQSPAFFGHLSKLGVPARSLLFAAILMLPALALVSMSDSAIQAFENLAGVIAVLYLTVWTMIIISYLCYRNKYPERHANSKYKLPGGRFSAWATMGFFAIVFIALGMGEGSRFSLLVAPVWFIAVFVLYRIFGKNNRAHASVTS